MKPHDLEDHCAGCWQEKIQLIEAVRALVAALTNLRMGRHGEIALDQHALAKAARILNDLPRG